jgi:hypothetical protein
MYHILQCRKGYWPELICLLQIEIFGLKTGCKLDWKVLKRCHLNRLKIVAPHNVEDKEKSAKKEGKRFAEIFILDNSRWKKSLEILKGSKVRLQGFLPPLFLKHVI